jgi:DNA-binding Lrp family transcriptional regulator
VLERISTDPLRVLRERIDLSEEEKSSLVARLREEESRRVERARA